MSLTRQGQVSSETSYGNAWSAVAGVRTAVRSAAVLGSRSAGAEAAHGRLLVPRMRAAAVAARRAHLRPRRLQRMLARASRLERMLCGVSAAGPDSAQHLQAGEAPSESVLRPAQVGSTPCCRTAGLR